LPPDKKLTKLPGKIHRLKIWFSNLCGTP